MAMMIRTIAQALHAEVKRSVAWDMDAPALRSIKACLVRRVRNQYGTRYGFSDGSYYFVPKGYATGSCAVRAVQL